MIRSAGFCADTAKKNSNEIKVRTSRDLSEKQVLAVEIFFGLFLIFKFFFIPVSGIFGDVIIDILIGRVAADDMIME